MVQYLVFLTGACSDTALPEAVTSPSPEDTSTDVELDDAQLAFDWVENEEGLFYAIYFDTDPMFPNPLTANFENGNTITGLAEDTTTIGKLKRIIVLVILHLKLGPLQQVQALQES